jgi:uncharacterized protein
VQFGSRYLPDRRDLNRSFPGSHEGSMAGRIARLLLDEVIATSDVGIDLHTAANHRTNVPQTRVLLEDETGEVAGRDVRCPVRVGGEAPAGIAPRGRVGAWRPVVTYEGGGPMRFDDDAIEVATAGTLRVLARLGMIDDAPPPAHSAPMILHAVPVAACRARRTARAARPGRRSASRQGQPLWTTVSPLGHERNTVRTQGRTGTSSARPPSRWCRPVRPCSTSRCQVIGRPTEDDPTDEEDDDDPDADEPA